MIAIRDRELPLRSIGGRVAQRPLRFPSPIPGVVHQAWQDNKVGRQHKNIVEAFRDVNPDIDFRLYNNDDQFDYMNTHYKGEAILKVFNGAVNGVMRADIFRYCVLRQQGGIYLDFSKHLQTPLHNFLELQSPCVLSHERNLIPTDLNLRIKPIDPMSGYLFVQWCLMAAPNHRFFNRMIENICIDAPRFNNIEFRNPKDALLRLTSSHMWTKSVWDELHALPELADYALVGADYKEEKFPLIPESYARYLVGGHYSTHSKRTILEMPS